MAGSCTNGRRFRSWGLLEGRELSWAGRCRCARSPRSSTRAPSCRRNSNPTCGPIHTPGRSRNCRSTCTASIWQSKREGFMDKKLIKRFLKYVDKSGGEDSCWTWLAYKESKKGHEYGRLSRSEGKSPYYAHRLSYEIAYGPIPDEFEVCHQCDNPECVNPKHLFLGTHQDNIHDASVKGRVRGGVKR